MFANLASCTRVSKDYENQTPPRTQNVFRRQLEVDGAQPRGIHVQIALYSGQGSTHGSQSRRSAKHDAFLKRLVEVPAVDCLGGAGMSQTGRGWADARNTRFAAHHTVCINRWPLGA